MSNFSRPGMDDFLARHASWNRVDLPGDKPTLIVEPVGQPVTHASSSSTAPVSFARKPFGSTDPVSEPTPDVGSGFVFDSGADNAVAALSFGDDFLI